jgi:hypothetical protein
VKSMRARRVRSPVDPSCRQPADVTCSVAAGDVRVDEFKDALEAAKIASLDTDFVREAQEVVLSTAPALAHSDRHAPFCYAAPPMNRPHPTQQASRYLRVSATLRAARHDLGALTPSRLGCEGSVHGERPAGVPRNARWTLCVLQVLDQLQPPRSAKPERQPWQHTPDDAADDADGPASERVQPPPASADEAIQRLADEVRRCAPAWRLVSQRTSPYKARPLAALGHVMVRYEASAWWLLVRPAVRRCSCQAGEQRVSEFSEAVADARAAGAPNHRVTRSDNPLFQRARGSQACPATSSSLPRT